MSEDLKTTALYECHKKLGAKTIPFGEWDMPVSYSGIIDEHQTVRSKCGIFDVSHMGEILVSGKEAYKFLQHLTINDLDRLSDGNGQYTAILNEKGGMIDDLILYRIKEDSYLLCVNASNIEKDFAWVKAQSKGFVVNVTDDSVNWSQIAIQGPTSQTAVQKIVGPDKLERLAQLKYMEIISLDIEGHKAYLARTGYTGEHGYEIYLHNEIAVGVWNALLSTHEDSGIKPVGLGARDTLRLEACYLLYGNDMDETVTPLEAGISWATRLQKSGFIGKEVLVSQKESGIPRKNIAFKMIDKAIGRGGMDVYHQDQLVGKITSGSKLPTLDFAGGMALVDRSIGVDDEIYIDIRGKRKLAKVVKKPLYTANVK